MSGREQRHEQHLRNCPPRAFQLLILVAVLFIFSAARVSAQQMEPSSYEGFEGRTVSNVDIAARPGIDVQSLRALIKQQPSQPFSVAAVNESVAALQNTKLFTQVQVSLQPQLSGLRVLFILQPAYYVGVLFFPGATGTFPYTRLLQAANIPDQTPFFSELLTEANRALLGLFKNAGFFAATVDAEAQPDDAHRVVNIVFRCNLGPRARVGLIEFDGISGQEAAVLRRSLDTLWAKIRTSSLAPGTKYSEGRITKALESLRSHYRKSGRLTPIVRLTSSTYDAETNRANLVMEVSPGPLVSVHVVGAHIFKRSLKRLIPIYEENAVDQDLVNEGGRNLVSYFQGKGYVDARVASRMKQEGKVLRILYEVDHGARYRVAKILFDGNRYFTASQLKPYLSVTQKHFPSFFFRGQASQDLLRKSASALTAFYQNEGFAQASVQYELHEHAPNLDVIFRISEGSQDRVSSVRIINSRKEPVKLLSGKQHLNIEPGKPYSPHLVESDRNQIVAEYLNHGYLNARFDSKVSPEQTNPHLKDVVYIVDPGTRAEISNVALLGPRQTRRRFIHTVIEHKIKAGAPLSEGNFLSAESELYNLGVFDWASVGPLRPVVDQASEEVLVKVHESKRNTMDIGGGIEVIPRSGNIPVGTVALPGVPPIGVGTKFTASQKSYFGPRVAFDFARHDLFGKAQTAGIGVLYSRLDQRANLTYSDQYLYGTSWSSLLSASVERNTEISIYTAVVGQGSLQIEKALDPNRTRLLRFLYTFQRTDLTNITIPDLVLPQDQHVRLSTFSAEFVRDTRDKPLDAHKGIYQIFSFGVTPTAIGSSSNFVRFLGQTAFYKQMEPWLVWANNFRLGVAAPFANSFVPLSERFFSGGPDSLRGFPINGAGPQRPVSVCSNPSDPSTCTVISVPVGGDMLAIVNSEARFPIPLKSGLGGVIFYDGGNVYSNINLHQFVTQYSNSVGFGIRYQTPVGPIRIDIGRNLSPIPGVNPTQYFVTLGQAF